MYRRVSRSLLTLAARVVGIATGNSFVPFDPRRS